MLALLLLIAVVSSWLYFAPPGLMGKADAVGYAVCHQIESRSFHMGERPLPLCARCSGMYIGAFVGILFQWMNGRKAGLPPKRILVALGFLVILFAIDGINSYIHLIPNIPGLYEPNNILRLVTGTGVGVGMALILIPIIHQTYWVDWDPASNISRWGEFFAILGSALAVSGLLLTGNPLLLYPLALISASTVLFILGMIYSIVWVMIFKKENQFATWKEVIPYLAFGFSTAVLQVFAIDIARLIVTGSWNGLNF